MWYEVSWVGGGWKTVYCSAETAYGWSCKKDHLWETHGDPLCLVLQLESNGTCLLYFMHSVNYINCYIIGNLINKVLYVTRTINTTSTRSKIWKLLVHSLIRCSHCVDLRWSLRDQLPAICSAALGDSNCWRGSNKYSVQLTGSICSTVKPLKSLLIKECH